LEKAVHVRAFLAKRPFKSYIKPIFQHELFKLLENGLDVRIWKSSCWKIALMYGSGKLHVGKQALMYGFGRALAGKRS